MRRFLPFLAILIIPIAAVMYVVLSSNDSDSSGNAGNPIPDAGLNLITDGSFEETAGPCTQEEGAVEPCWFSLREPEWILSDEKSFSGEKSALLQMRDTEDSEETKIYYLVQEFAVDPSQPLPEVISGEYFVENWHSGTKNQYLQFVVILWGNDFSNLPICPSEDAACPNYQIRYLLAGIEEDPFPIDNAKFVYIDSQDPVEGQWIHFERNLHEDFQEFWGGVPHDVTRIRLLYEVRYDDKLTGEGPLEADVYYDNLYLGSAENAP